MATTTVDPRATKAPQSVMTPPPGAGGTYSDAQLTAYVRSVIPKLHPAIQKNIGDPRQIRVRQGVPQRKDSNPNAPMQYEHETHTIWVNPAFAQDFLTGKYENAIAHELTHQVNDYRKIKEKVGATENEGLEPFVNRNAQGKPMPRTIPEVYGTLRQWRKQGKRMADLNNEQRGYVSQYRQLLAQNLRGELDPKARSEGEQQLQIFDLYMNDLSDEVKNPEHQAQPEPSWSKKLKEIFVPSAVQGWLDKPQTMKLVPPPAPELPVIKGVTGNYVSQYEDQQTQQNPPPKKKISQTEVALPGGEDKAQTQPEAQNGKSNWFDSNSPKSPLKQSKPESAGKNTWFDSSSPKVPLKQAAPEAKQKKDVLTGMTRNWQPLPGLGIAPETPLPEHMELNRLPEFRHTPTPAEELRNKAEESMEATGQGHVQPVRTTPAPKTFGELGWELRHGGPRYRMEPATHYLGTVPGARPPEMKTMTKDDEKLLRKKEEAKAAARQRVMVYRAPDKATSPIAGDQLREAYKFETVIDNAQSAEQIDKIMRLDEADRAGNLEYTFEKIVEKNHDPLFTADDLDPAVIDGVAMAMSNIHPGLPVSRGVARGMINSTGQLLSPENIELMAILPEVKGAEAVISGIFAVQGITGAHDQLTAAYDAYQKGETDEAQELAVEGMVSALMGAAASVHVASETIPALKGFVADPLKTVMPTDPVRVTEYIKQQAETARREAALPGQATETTEPLRREHFSEKIAREEEEKRKATRNTKPGEMTAPPEERPFAEKLKTAMEAPSKSEAALTQVGREVEKAVEGPMGKVAAEVRKATESAKPDLGEMVYAAAEKLQPQVPDPHLVAEDIRYKKPTARTAEEKAFLVNYDLWKSLPLVLEEERLRTEAGDLERRANRAGSPEEADSLAREAILKRQQMERAQKLRDDERAKRRAAKQETQPAPRGQDIHVWPGKQTEIPVPGLLAPLKAEYVGARLSSLVTSHNHESFEWSPDYPQALQPRDLKTDKGAQLKTIEDAQPENFVPRRMVSDADTAELGPPIILSDGPVAAGNRRLTMFKIWWDRADRTARERMLGILREGRSKFYIDDTPQPGEFDDPIVVVRRLEERPEDTASLAILGQDLNRNFTQGFTPDAQAVMNGQRLEIGHVQKIAAWIDALPEGTQTLAGLMNARPTEIYDLMVQTGLVAPNQITAYMHDDRLTPAAKDTFKSAILGKVIDDPEILAHSEPWLKDKIANALVPLVEMREKGAESPWNVLDSLKDAMRLWNRIEPLRDKYDEMGRKSDSMIDKYLNPEKTGLPGYLYAGMRETTPTAEALAKLLDLSGLRFRRALLAFIDKSATKSFFEEYDPREEFNRSIGKEVGVEVHPLDWDVNTPASAEEKLAYDERMKNADKGPTPEQKFAEQTARQPNAEAEKTAAAERLSTEVTDKTVTPESLQAFFEKHENLRAWAEPLMEVFGEIIPRATGLTLPEFLSRAFETMRHGDEPGAKGAYEWATKTLEMFRKADAITASHEFLHAMRRLMNTRDLARLRGYVHEILRRAGRSEEELARLGQSDWTPEEDEILARAWDLYLTEGKAPTVETETIFARLKNAFRKTYQAIRDWETKAGIKVELLPEAVKTFDSWFNREETSIEAPPAEAMSLFPASALETIDEVWQPGEIDPENPPRLVLESSLDNQPNFGEVAGPRLGMRFSATEGRADLRARDFINLNKENLLGFRVWTPTTGISVGDAVMEYVLKQGAKLYQKAEPEWEEIAPGIRIQRTKEMTAPPEMKLKAPPGVTETIEVSREAAGAKATDEERARSDERAVLQQAERAGDVAEPADGPASGKAPESGVSGRGRGRAGAAKRVTAQLKLPQVLAETIPLDNARPELPEKPPVIAPEQWRAKYIENRIPENTPAPTHRLSAQIAAVLRWGQPELGDVMYSGLHQFNAVINAVPTGGGKTFTSLAVARQMRVDGTANRILIVTRNSTILDKSWRSVARDRFGMTVRDLPEDAKEMLDTGTYGMTYRGLIANENAWVARQKWDLIILDESQEAANWHTSQQGRIARQLSDNAGKAIYCSATPFSNALDYGYMTKLGLWGKHSEKVPDFESWVKQFGVTKQTTKRMLWDNGRARQVKETRWLGSGINPHKLLKEREQLIARGQFAYQEKSMEGYAAHFVMTEVTPEMKARMKQAQSYFTRAENYYKQRGDKNRALTARRVGATWMKAYLERSRLPETIELMKQAHDQGWQVLLQSESSAERTERHTFTKEANEAMKAAGLPELTLPDLPGVVETLNAQLGEENVGNYSGGKDAKREAALKNWRKGETPYLYASYGAGGVGVDMDDTTIGGVRPVAVFYLGPAYSVKMLEQAEGRPWRATTTSDVLAVYMTSAALPELDMMQKIAGKLAAQKAAVHGITDDGWIKAVRRLPQVRETTAGFWAGADVTHGMEQFTNTVNDVPVMNYKAVKLPSAKEAMGKGMRHPGEAITRPERFLSVEESKAVIDAHETLKALVEGETMPVVGEMMKDWPREERQIVASTLRANVEEAIRLADNDAKSAAGQDAVRLGMKELLAAERVGRVKLLTDSEKTAWEMEMEGEAGEKPPPAKKMNLAMMVFNYVKRSGGMALESIGRHAGKPEAGTEMRSRKDRFFATQQTIKGRLDWRDDEILAENKISKKNFPQVAMVMEGKLPAPNERIAKAARELREHQDYKAELLSKAGVQTYRIDEDGRETAHDFKKREDHFPHMFRMDEKHTLKDPTTGEVVTVTLEELLGGTLAGLKSERVMNALQEKTGKTRYEVQKLLEAQKRHGKRAGNIERSREADLPLYRTDREVLRDYNAQVAELLARKEHVGQRWERIDALIAELGNEDLQKQAEEIFAPLRDPERWDKDFGLIYGIATTYEMLSKMTFSAPKIAMHWVHTGVVMGNVDALIRGVFRGVTNPREVYRLAKECGVIADHAIADSDLVKQAKRIPGTIAHWHMMLSGSEPVFRMQRALLNAGVQREMSNSILPQLMKKAKSSERLRRQLREVMALDEAQIDQAIKVGRWTEEDLNRGSAAAVNKIMFNPKDPLQMPPFLRLQTGSRWGQFEMGLVRMAYTMGSFHFKTATLLRETLIRETARGNLRPLMNFATMYPVTGLMMSLGTAGLQTAFQMTMYSIYPEKKPEGWKSPLEKRVAGLEELAQNPTWRGMVKEYFTDLTDAAAMGMTKQIMSEIESMTSGNKREAEFKRKTMGPDALEKVFGPIWSDLYKTSVYAEKEAGTRLKYLDPEEDLRTEFRQFFGGELSDEDAEKRAKELDKNRRWWLREESPALRQMVAPMAPPPEE